MNGPAIEVSHLRRLWLYVLFALMILYLVGPIFIVIPMSFSASSYLEFPPAQWSMRWYFDYFSSDEWMAATRVSVWVAVTTTAIATPVGTLAAYSLHRHYGRLARISHGILLLPQILPGILVAIGVYFLYTKLDLINRFAGIVAAHTALAIPFVVVTVLAGFQSFDDSLEDAACGLGASRWRAVIDVTLPQLRLSLIAGALFAFITSFDEVVLGLFISGGDNIVLPRKMFLALHDQIDPTIAAISTMLIMLSMIGIVLFLFIQKPGKAAG